MVATHAAEEASLGAQPQQQPLRYTDATHLLRHSINRCR